MSLREAQPVCDLPLLPTIAELHARLAPSALSTKTVRDARAAIRAVLHAHDPRLIVIVGPCSIHDPASAREYALRLQRLAVRHADTLVLVMRTYFEKPRSTLGWKGLVSDPHLDDSCDIAAGLATARRLLLEINQLGVPCATELLDPLAAGYLSDLISWAAIGARTTESQPHREMVSGLSMPVGFKNATSGDIDVAADAILSASSPHRFLSVHSAGRAGIVQTDGNPDTHVVLRGSHSGANYDAESVRRAAEAAARRGAPKRSVLVDCSHGNSNKDHRRQATAWRAVLEQLQEPDSPIGGLLLESNLRPGNQAWKPGAKLRRGVSITDACVGWSETQRLIEMAAEAIRTARRGL